jgi:peptidoglycan hydrolase-like protein with peptidoglycan-binding domain
MLVLSPPLSETAQGDKVKTVQTNLAKIGFTLPGAETNQTTFGVGTAEAVKQFQAQAHLPITGIVDTTTQAMLNSAAAVAGTNQVQVTGQLFMDYGLPAKGVTLRLYWIGFGGTALKLVETQSDANGVYSLAYAPPPAPSTNLEVRAVDPQGKEVTISGVIYNITQTVVLNLVAPATVQPLTAEYQRLSSDLQPAIGGIQKLGTAQQSDTQQDLTLLNQTTGWDARLLTLGGTLGSGSKISHSASRPIFCHSGYFHARNAPLALDAKLTFVASSFLRCGRRRERRRNRREIQVFEARFRCLAKACCKSS